jgi:hypothetical protein
MCFFPSGGAVAGVDVKPFVQDASRGMVAGRWASIADFLAEWLDEPRLAPEQQATLDR